MRNINEVFPFNVKHLRAFIAVYNEFYPPIKYFTWQLLEDKKTAEAVTLNAFIKLWNSSVLCKDSEQIENYLFRIAGITCYQLENKQPQPTWFTPLRRERYPENRYASLAREAITFNELAKVFQHPGSPETYENISSLFVKHLTGIATAAENMQLDEWMSLSVENRKWFDRFNNYDFIKFRLGRMEEIYRDANPNDCLRLLYKPLQAKQRRMRQLGYTAAAAVLILFAASWFYSYLFPKVTLKPTLAQTTPAMENGVKVHRSAAPARTFNDSTKNNGKLSEKPNRHENSGNKPVRHRHQPPVAREEQQQPDAQFARRNSPEAWSIEGPQQKEHWIINLNQAILPNHRLPDGSFITLNAGSELGYPNDFDKAKRKITLRGEAYFTIIQDDSLPFLVAANGVHTETSDGVFTIRSYPDENLTTITALTGKSLSVAAGPYEIKLPAGQTAVIKKGSPIVVYKTVNPEKTIAYKNLRFHFDNDNLNQVAAEIARWYGLTVVGVDSADTRVSFVGSRLMKVEDVIKHLVTSDGQPRLILQGDQLLLCEQLIHTQPVILTRDQMEVKTARSLRSGKVVNQLGEPVIDATVTNLHNGISVITDRKGIFSFKVLTPNTFLKVYGINIKTDSFFVRRVRDILIQVEEKVIPNVATVAIYQ